MNVSNLGIATLPYVSACVCKYSHAQFYVFPQPGDVCLNMPVYETPERFHLPISPQHMCL